MKKRLTIENRILIKDLLKLNYKLKDISSFIECEPSTISRKVKKGSLVKVILKYVINPKDFLLFVMDVKIEHTVE